MVYVMGCEGSRLLKTLPGVVAEACFARDAALHQATPWADYIAAHPILLQRVPKGA